MIDDLLIFLAGGLFSGFVLFLLLRFGRTRQDKARTTITDHATQAEPNVDGDASSSVDAVPGRLGDLHAQHLEAAARIREQRAASRAAREAKRIAAEDEARREAERLAAEEVIRREAQRIAAEELARRDALRIATEDAARLEAQRIAAEEKAAQEAQRLAAAAEEAARLEAQRIAAEERVAREAQRMAAVEEARREVQRIAAEEKARQDAQRDAAEAQAASEAQRLAVEDEERRESQRIAAEQAARLEAERMAAEAEVARAAQQAAAAEESHLLAESAPKPVTPKLPSEAVVMIVDDSKVGRIKTNRFLVNNQFQSQMAEDGCDALEKISAHMPDIVITDVEMPNMDGFELTKQIRSNPATAHIPVIVISGNHDGYEEKAIEVGADLILGKPYSEENMIAQIHQFLRNGRPSIGA